MARRLAPPAGESTQRSEDKFRRRFFDSGDKEADRHSFGDALAAEIKFQKIKSELTNLLYLNKPPSVVMAELRLDNSEFELFSKRIQRLRQPASESANLSLFEDREYTSLEDFLSGHSGDLDIITLKSYYSILKPYAAKELSETRYCKDNSGILMSYGKINGLLRAAFRHKYSPQIVEYLIKNKIQPIRVQTLETDVTTFAKHRTRQIMRDGVYCQVECPVRDVVIRYRAASFEEGTFASYLRDLKSQQVQAYNNRLKPHILEQKS